MKKAASLIVFLLVFSNCFSQNSLQTGLTIGYNSSTFSGHDKHGKKLYSMPGFYLGGIINYKLDNRFSVLTNVSLSSRGTQINTINELREPVLFLYLDIPVMVRLKLLQTKKISPYAEVGGAFNWIFSADIT